jgi:HTH-type transcriptional regulator, quorum sensing regulator NprR
MEEHSVIGKKIKEVRTDLGLSQRQLAGNEITRAYISIIEKGHAVPSEKTLKIIAQRLEKPIEYFLGETQEESLEICDAILERAKLKISNNDLETSLKIINKVFAMTQDKQLLGDAYILLMQVNTELECFEAVLEKGEEALPILLELKDREYLVKFYLYMGKAAFRTESFSTAKKYYKFAIKYSNQLKKLQLERIQALTYLGTTNLRLGVCLEAIEAYRTAAEEVTLIDDFSLRADVYLGLGKAYFLNDMKEIGIDWTKRSIESYKKINSEQEVLALHNLAIMEADVGNKEEVLCLLTACLNTYKEKGQYRQQALVLEEISVLYLEKDDIKQAKKNCSIGIKLLEEEENGILRARLYRLMGVILHCDNQSEQSYYFFRMSYDLLIRLKSKEEASISLTLLKAINQHNIKTLFFKHYKHY